MNAIDEADLQPGDEITIHDIEWDLDGATPEEAGVDTTMNLTLPDDWDEGDIADLLSDRTGWCVLGYGDITYA